MSKEATFSFKGKDNVSEALKTINQNVQKVTKATKNAAKSINTFNAALIVLKATVNGIGKIISFALNTIIKAVQAALRTLKNIITGLFKFIKTALSTLLSWTIKALGKVFDGIKKLFTNIFNFSKDVFKKTTQVIKKGIESIIDSVKGYAEDEYNEIQLKVSLGDSYDQVMKSFNKLLRYTTSSDDELLSVFATFAEVGKKPEEIEKYAKASIYLANATGRSLNQITRLLLGQEAAGTDLERLLHRLGINISEQEQSISNIDKIIRQLEPEMEALANSSLKQLFSNVKNDLATIQDTIGAIFSGPVRYVADKLDKLLVKINNSKKFETWAEKIDAIFEKVKPFIDKLFNYAWAIFQDPEGFLKALWADIKQIFSNIKNNFVEIVGIIGKIIGISFQALFDLFKKINFESLVSDLTTALNSFVLNFGAGIGWWSQEDINKAEGSVKNLLINAWNDAHPNFTLSKDDKWYENLKTLLIGIWTDDLKPLLNSIWTDDLKPILDNVIDWVKNTLAPILGEVFTWLGDVLSAAFTNFLLQSEVLRKIMSAIGMPIATRQDQTASYEKVKQWLPQTIVDGNVWRDFKSTDLTYDFLNSRYTGKGFTGTWMQYLETVSGLVGEDLNLLRRVARADTITENAKVPTIGDLFTRIDNVLNPVTEAVTEVEDKLPHNYKNLYEDLHDDIRGKLIPELTEEEKATKDLVRELKSHVTVLHVIPTSTGYGSGGIQDYFGQNEFKIKPYAKGGVVTKPTYALIGEAGPEVVIPLKNIPKLANADAERYNLGPNVDLALYDTSAGKQDEETYMDQVLDLINGATGTILEGVDNTENFFKNMNNSIENVVVDANKAFREADKEDLNTSAFQKWIDNSKVGKAFIATGKILLSIGNFFQTSPIFTKEFWVKSWNDFKYLFSKSFWTAKWDDALDGLVTVIGKTISGFIGGSFKGVGFLAQHGAFGTHVGNIYQGSFDENGTFSILKMFSAIIQELIPYLEEGLSLIGGLFDQAFEILANTVKILGERLGKTLLPILEAFIPLMKIISDILIALAPVVESVLQPAIMIITAILQALVPILDMLMPIFAGIGAVIQWVAESISWVVGSLINWLASWLPIQGVGEVKKPGSIKSNYNTIMDAYYAARATPANTITASSTSTASQTASYNGASVIHIHNDFSGSYVVGTNGFRELALIIKNTLQDLDYSGQTI